MNASIWIPCMLLVAWPLLAGSAVGSDGGNLAVSTLPDDVIEVDILKLTSIDYEEGKELPEEIQELDGKKIVISGYMQSRPKKDVSTFLIVANSCQCSGRPLVHHFVEITLENGKTGYRPGELTFMGTLSVGEVRGDDGFVTSLYRLEGDFF